MASLVEPADQSTHLQAGRARPGGWTPRLVGILLALICAGELAQLTFTYPVNALPLIAGYFGTDQVAWVSTTGSVAGGITAAIIGKLADRFGKKRVLLTVMVVTLVGLAISGLATSFGVLLVGRALQGPSLAIVFLIPSLVRDIYPTRTVPVAISIGSSGAGGFSIVAALLLGPVLAAYGFRGSFWVPAAFGALAVVLVLFVPADTPQRIRSSLDLPSALLLGAGVAAVLTALSLGGTYGWTSPRILLLAVLGVLLLVGWVVRSLRTPEPLIDLRLLASPPVAATLALSAIGLSIAVWFYTLMSFNVVGRGPGWGLGLPAGRESLYLTIYTVSTFLTGFVAGWAVRRFRLPTVGAAAMVVAVLGYLVALLGLTSPVLFAVAAVLVGTVGGSTVAVTYNLIVLLVDRAQQATGASIVSLCANFGSAVLSVALFTAMNGQAQTVPGVFPHSALVLATVVPACLAAVGLGINLLLRRRPGLRAGTQS